MSAGYVAKAEILPTLSTYMFLSVYSEFFDRYKIKIIILCNNKDNHLCQCFATL